MCRQLSKQNYTHIHKILTSFSFSPPTHTVIHTYTLMTGPGPTQILVPHQTKPQEIP